MSCHESAQIIRVESSRQVVPSRNGAEGARVIVEAYRVVDPRGFGGLLAKPRHAFDGIVEPPGWSQTDGRIVSGERRQLARIGRLVEREQDQSKARVVAVRVEQLGQISRVFRGNRDVAALVWSEAVGHQ